MNSSSAFSSPHIHQAPSVQQVMCQVILALVPGILFSTWIYGWGVLIQCFLAVLFAQVLEAIMLRLRKQPLQLFLFDGSAVVTALLFALCITPYTPWWINLVGMAFAISIAKHCYGGLGQNIFNPAMAAYIFVLLCFPLELSLHPAAGHYPGLRDTLEIIAFGIQGYSDGVSGATVLATLKTGLDGMGMISEIRTSPVFGQLAGKGSEWIPVFWLAGGIWLAYQKIIKWQVPAAFLAVLFVISLIFYWYDDSHYISPLFTLLAGGSMLAAFFIITEPVSSSTTPAGRIIFASGVAIIAYVIRTWGNYPDGVAFAVLLMNFSAPIIDRLTRPKVVGET